MRGDSHPTLNDVAREAGVSAMTVSNVVRNKHRSMSAKTRARVERAIASLNYRPHASARSLRLARRFSIGMLVVEESPRFLADPFITHLVAGLTNFLSERGYDLVLQGLKPANLASSRMLQNVRTDGLCVLLSGSVPDRACTLNTLHALHQPIVLFQQRADPGPNDLCTVRQHDREGGRLLAKLLLERGARDLLMLVPTLEWPAIGERVDGVREAVRAHGGDARMTVLATGESFDDTRQALARQLDLGAAPDAVLAGNDQMGIAAVKCLAARGISVPGDVRVTGFNAFEFRQ